MTREISTHTVVDLSAAFDLLTLGDLEREAVELATRGGPTSAAWLKVAAMFADARALAELQQRYRGGRDG